MCSKWIEYKGEKILYQDFSHHGLLDTETAGDEFALMQQIILAQPPGTVRVLADFRNSQIMKDLMDVMIKNSALTRAHIKKTAALGVAGPKRILLEMIINITGQPITFFENLETAQQWLVE